MHPSAYADMDGQHPTVASPCVRNCCLDHDDVCLGCFRTLDEILAWGGSGAPEREAILASATVRAAHHPFGTSWSKAAGGGFQPLSPLL